MVIMQIAAQQSFGAAGCYFGAETTLQLTAAANKVLDRGLWLVALSANDLVEYSPDAGVTYRTALPALTGGQIFSDGYNVRIRNTGVADTGSDKTFYSQILAVPGI